MQGLCFVYMLQLDKKASTVAGIAKMLEGAMKAYTIIVAANASDQLRCEFMLSFPQVQR
jgi:F0F1-type ATP synthase alpha subunit